jgi:SAM-dependent methyltransferase
LKGGVILDSIEYYNRHASDYYENTVELSMGEYLERFMELIPDGAAVLDLGCGSGRDSLYLLEQGYDVTALDGSEELCELAKIHIGQEVLHLTYNEIDFDEVFDGIWASASLIHLDNDELDQVMNRLLKSLKPGGVIYMSFRYGDFSGMEEERYFHDYGVHSLRDLISKYDELELIDMIKSEDFRPEKKGKYWISTFVRKVQVQEHEYE